MIKQMTDHVFRKAAEADLKAVFLLYEARVCWMKRKNLRQWDATDYLSVYTTGYFRKQMDAENLYVLENLKDKRVMGAVVLLCDDGRWDDNPPAYYIHNLVTGVQETGVGREILKAVEVLARASGKTCLRLDCAADNTFLNAYYASMGYAAAGTCQEGVYHGVRREKKLV